MEAKIKKFSENIKKYQEKLRNGEFVMFYKNDLDLIKDLKNCDCRNNAYDLDPSYCVCLKEFPLKIIPDKFLKCSCFIELRSKDNKVIQRFLKIDHLNPDIILQEIDYMFFKMNESLGFRIDDKCIFKKIYTINNWEE